MSKEVTDKQRLDWLEEITGQGACPSIINDDGGHWAVAFDGVQDVPIDTPMDMHTTFFVEKDRWCDTIRGAIDKAMAEHKEEKDRE